jgi:transposase
MIKSVGIDLAGIGEHKVRCLDERAQMCDGFSFETTTAGLAKLEERVFGNGANSVIIFEPTGLAWLPVAVYIKARHPDSRLVRVQAQKVVALRKYLNRSSKSDKIDSLTLAKMPFIDPEQLYLEIHPSDNLRTIPGVGDHTAPIFLATIGDPARFRSQSSFANYCGIVPGASQSAGSEAKGLRMTKAGPAIMRWALFQAGGIGRAHDPQLACIYYREMVHNGKNHTQAIGAGFQGNALESQVSQPLDFGKKLSSSTKPRRLCRSNSLREPSLKAA